MKIVVAPQALKGSLDAPEVGAAIAAGLQAANPDIAVTVIPVADGGEGTVRALVAATGGELRHSQVRSPLGQPVSAEWGILGASAHGLAGETAVIEMAAASGIMLVPTDKRDPLHASTFGTGELMRAALDAGCTTLLIGIGGSATNDGGAGMAQALGARLLDASGAELPPGGAALVRLDRVDASTMDARMAKANIIVASDVTNPLCGPEGASAIFGPQKGATPEMVATLDTALAHYAEVLKRDLSADVAAQPGAGAAGGLGAGLLAFAHAALVPGSTLVLDALDFERRIAGTNLVITAEGRLDAQTGYGKAVGAVAAAARRQGARAIALAGSVALNATELAALGLDAAIPIADGPRTLEESMARASELLTTAAERTLRLVMLGQGIEH